MLAVLLAGARSDRVRPSLGDSADLIVTALAMRGRLRARSNSTVLWAVRLMMLAGALEAVALGTVVGTSRQLLVAVGHRYPAMHAAQLHQIVSAQVVAMKIGAPIAAGLWLWLAWSNDRGHRRGRPLVGVLFAATSLSLFAALANGAVTLAPLDVIAGGALWVVALAALALLISPRSNGHYQRRLAG